MTRESPASGSSRGQSKRQSRSRGWRFVIPVLLIGALAALFVRSALVDFFYISSESMTPSLQPGDGLLVDRTAYDGMPARGDVVVFDGAGTLAPYRSSNPIDDLLKAMRVTGNGDYFVKRVIAVEGDTLACCDPDGLLQLNGNPLPEPYLHDGDAPSRVEFEVTVPEGRFWVMGDHRSDSADSRALLGAPGGGMIPADRVVGRVDSIVWPLGRIGIEP
ncbi:signal peptidase I [Zhihengliuella salsuginis]|uniref:Signal peptidase I n=1 Tax=Zhihengliuella salsuginis TaxID=578222 RepID=A0ABQ3GK46_9MICC|nr:signal peptidase I [Zhihengliuella salsuginis]GHD11886.1 signal peptidase I [Zhihengliuella salsuginis]